MDKSGWSLWLHLIWSPRWKNRGLNGIHVYRKFCIIQDFWLQHFWDIFLPVFLGIDPQKCCRLYRTHWGKLGTKGPLNKLSQNQGIGRDCLKGNRPIQMSNFGIKFRPLAVRHIATDVIQNRAVAHGGNCPFGRDPGSSFLGLSATSPYENVI